MNKISPTVQAVFKKSDISVESFGINLVAYALRELYRNI
jgi:hypothetical protein